MYSFDNSLKLNMFATELGSYQENIAVSDSKSKPKAGGFSLDAAQELMTAVGKWGFTQAEAELINQLARLNMVNLGKENTRERELNVQARILMRYDDKDTFNLHKGNLLAMIQELESVDVSDIFESAGL